MIIVPIKRLSPDTLQAIIAQFVLREGSDYGENECSFADKTAQVLAQLEAGTAIVTFDEQTGSVNIVSSTTYTPVAALPDATQADAALLTIRQQLDP